MQLYKLINRNKQTDRVAGESWRFVDLDWHKDIATGRIALHDDQSSD